MKRRRCCSAKRSRPRATQRCIPNRFAKTASVRGSRRNSTSRAAVARLAQAAEERQAHLADREPLEQPLAAVDAGAEDVAHQARQWPPVAAHRQAVEVHRDPQDLR